MSSEAKGYFDQHISECTEALEVYKYLRQSGYEASFGLRFVWVAAVSALDHYITQLVIEKGTEAIVNEEEGADRLFPLLVSMENALDLRDANPVEAALVVRRAIGEAVRYRSFQNANDVAAGLAYVWSEQHKWHQIAGEIEISSQVARETLNNIVNRRNVIAHNADFDEAIGSRTPVAPEDAETVINYLSNLVGAIDSLVDKSAAV